MIKTDSTGRRRQEEEQEEVREEGVRGSGEGHRVRTVAGAAGGPRHARRSQRADLLHLSTG
jgi:hypothetical protein